MKTYIQKIPTKLTSYIKQNFKEDFLFEFETIKKTRNENYFVIKVSKDNYIHELIFNGEGEVIKEKAEQAFLPDVNEEEFYRDVPE